MVSEINSPNYDETVELMETFESNTNKRVADLEKELAAGTFEFVNPSYDKEGVSAYEDIMHIIKEHHGTSGAFKEAASR